MNLALLRSSFLIRKVYPSAICRLSSLKKVVYLTFDDGPQPGVTDWVLNLLSNRNAKATFFVVGQNVNRSPDLFQRILEEGHRCGNHTYNHLKGWFTPLSFYLENIELCNERVKTDLFRPPYGRMTPAQYRRIKKKYKVIMWDVLSHDYLQSLSKEECLSNTIKLTRNGSIVVFHDSIKAQKNLEFVLPRYLDWLNDNGYQCKVL
jgi:peptidoglycan/xylan/chitin deacetylase (PgdA/CDA1 family)